VVGVAQHEFEDVANAEPTRVDEVVVDGIGDIVEAAQDEKRVVEFTRVDKEPATFTDREVHALGWVVRRAVGRDAAAWGGLQGSVKDGRQVAGGRGTPVRSGVARARVQASRRWSWKQVHPGESSAARNRASAETLE
jgi:hypothetical protein